MLLIFGTRAVEDLLRTLVFVCRVCGRSVEVDGPEVEAWAELVAEKHGYTEISHTVELFGRCAKHSV